MKNNTFYIALDTEYVQKSHASNTLLSWQFCISTDLENISDGYIRIIENDEKRPLLDEIIVDIFDTMNIPIQHLDGAHIVLICHYAPAEISMLTNAIGQEKIYDIKYLTENMEYVRKTLISLLNQHKSLSVNYQVEDDRIETYKFTYEFFDTMLIAPNGATSLFDLSKSLNDDSFLKKDMNTYEISHMDWVLEYKREKFIEYAVNDARATLKAFIELQNNFNNLAENEDLELYKTIGSAVLKYYKKFMMDNYKLSLPKLIGKGTSTYQLTYKQFSDSYLGGRNETFFIGKAPEDYIYFDIDYKNAYPTCLSMLYRVDWSSSPMTIRNMQALLNQKDIFKHCTYVHAKFKFSKDIKYPCLPVYHESYGLIYPLKGVTYTTAHEIFLAHKMGAEIDIIDCKVLSIEKDFDSYSYPFKTFYKKVIKERSKYKKGSLKNLLFKEYANTLYGKVSQNVSKKKMVSLFDLESKELGDSHVTSPAYASNITGMMRAALGELLYTCELLNQNDKNKYLPINGVTDGALIGVKKSSFSAETLKKIEKKDFKNIEEVLPEFMQKLKTSNLIQQIIDTRLDITDKEDFLEIKSISNEVWAFKTRGAVGYYDEEVTILSKAGHKPPKIRDTYEEDFTINSECIKFKNDYMRPPTKEDSAKWLIDVYNTLPEITTYDFERVISFKDLLYNDQYDDIVNAISERKTNLDFDYKRKPYFEEDKRDEKEQLTELLDIDTIPYKNLSEMVIWRKASDNLRNSGKRTVEGRTSGYRSTPVRVHTKIFSEEFKKERLKLGRKGSKAKILRYVVHAYVLNKLDPYNNQYKYYADIARLFEHPDFITEEKKLLIDRKIISADVKKKFTLAGLENNSYTRTWTKKVLERLAIVPTNAIMKKLISNYRGS